MTAKRDDLCELLEDWHYKQSWTSFFDFDFLLLNIQLWDVYITECSKKNKQLYCSAHTNMQVM